MEESAAQIIRNSIQDCRFNITNEHEYTLKDKGKKPKQVYVMHVEHEDETPTNHIGRTLKTALMFMENIHPNVKVKIETISSRHATISFTKKK